MVAAAFLHFGLVGYLIVMVPLVLILLPAKGGIEDVLRLGLRLSGVFLLGFLALGGVAVTLAAMADGRARRRIRRVSLTAPALARRRVVDATDGAGRALDSASRLMLERIASRSWIYDDDRYQALARDLDMIVRTAIAAQADAPSGVTTEIAQECAMSLGVIDQALGELEHERASAAATDVRAAALYIRRRYGATDFAIKPD